MSSLQRNFSWTLTGNLTYAACQWLVVVLIAKLGSPALVGQFTLAVAICSPIMLLCGMALRVVQANDVERRYPFSVYLGLRLSATVAALLVIGAVVAVNNYPADTATIVLLVAAAKAAEATSEIFWGQFQQQERMRAIAFSMMIKGALSVAAVGALIAVTGSLVTATLGLAGAWLTSLVLFDVSVARATIAEPLRPTFDPMPLYRLARLAIPLGIIVMLVSFANNVPRYFLSGYRGDHDVGVFSAVANLMVAGTTVFTALGQAVSPRFARHYVARDRGSYLRILRVLCQAALALGAAGVLIAAAFGEQVLALLYTTEYSAAADVLLLTMFAAVPSYFISAFGVALIALGEFRAPVPLQALNLAIVIAGCQIMVPRAGMVGAAWVVLVANLVTAALFGLVVWSRTRRFDGRPVQPTPERPC